MTRSEPTDNTQAADAGLAVSASLPNDTAAAAAAGVPGDAAPSGKQFGNWLDRLPYIPVFFLGLGIYRAWIEISFVGSFIDFPADQFARQDVFDIILVLTVLCGALFARRLGTLLNRAIAYWASGILLTIATAGVFLAYWTPSLESMLSYPSAILGGIGIGILILMWSEVYSGLNPIRVALYYSASMLAAAAIIYLCQGLLIPWLTVIVMLLPPASLVCVLTSYRSIPSGDLSSTPNRSFSFPWKPVALMAVYGFAYGLKEVSMILSSGGPHSAWGTIAVAAFVFIGVLAQGERFDFALIYRIGLPLMVGAFLLLPSFGFVNESVSAFCVSASYAAFSILIMLILSNMSYRYGISALWLFGFERGVRLFFVYLGRQVSSHADVLGIFGFDHDMLINALIILMVILLSLILFSERELSSRWGVTFLSGSGAAADSEILRKQELATHVSELARSHGLSQREGEVLLLLAQKKTIATIERELFIANGTAKAHVRHIYQKLSIHARDELFELLESEMEH
jgi:DNA-binding CsgD family transcriptional regulator